MKVFCVTSYDEIKEITDQVGLEAGREILYRGTNNSLVPSIVEKYSFNSYADLIAREYFLLNDFQSFSQIKYDFKEKIARDWEIRIRACEYGLASRLIDWSNSLDTALEFAIHQFERKKIEYTSLWILNTLKLNQILIAEEMNKKDSFQEIVCPSIIQFKNHSKANYPSSRYTQGGYFLFQSSLEVIVSLDKNPFFSELLTHIVIPQNIVPKIRKDIFLEEKPDLRSDFYDFDETLSKKCRQLNKMY